MRSAAPEFAAKFVERAVCTRLTRGALPDGARSYRKKGLLGMAERNLKIKPNPERWQDTRDIGALDVVFCFQERVFDALVEGAGGRAGVAPPCRRDSAPPAPARRRAVPRPAGLAPATRHQPRGHRQCQRSSQGRAARAAILPQRASSDCSCHRRRRVLTPRHAAAPQCDASENLEQDMPRLVEEFENAFERPLSYALFYV